MRTGALRCVLVSSVDGLRPAAPCRAHASSAHGEKYACINEGASLSAVELRRGSMVIPKHDAAAAACGISDWRLLRIHFVISEKLLALGAALRNTQLFSTLSVCNDYWTNASAVLSQTFSPSTARDGRTDEPRSLLALSGNDSTLLPRFWSPMCMSFGPHHPS